MARQNVVHPGVQEPAVELVVVNARDAEDRVDPEMAKVALAAALLHDLGHGPYSHAFEAVLPHDFRHEDWTSKLELFGS